MKKNIIFLTLCFVTIYSKADITISLPKVLKDSAIRLNNFWKYHEGDNLNWAKPEFNDTEWDSIEIGQSEKTFDGIIWLRLSFKTDTSLFDKTFAFEIYQMGASEIFIDGDKIISYGKVAAKRSNEIPFNPYNYPLIVKFKKQVNHLIAIRYSNNIASSDEKLIYFPELLVSESNMMIGKKFKSTFFNLTLNSVFLGFAAAITILHLLLFLFYKADKNNLYFSIFTGLWTISTIISQIESYSTDSIFIQKLESLTMIIFPIFVFSLLLFVYTLFQERKKYLFWTIAILTALTLSASFISYNYYGIGLIGLILIIVVSVIFIIWKAIRRKQDGSGIIGIGILIAISYYVIIFSATFLTSFKLLPNIIVASLLAISFFMSNISIMISMSVYLARKFARNTNMLQVKLGEVELLSAKTIQQEKENKKILEEQNILLEIKVIERTTELKKSQQYLIQQEKMASLGQLTAGVAHEINNPINFVSSNVKPLKRNFDELVDFIFKKKELNEEDLNYNIVESKQLFSGIEEGAYRTTEIVRGLRNFSRLDEGELKKVDLNEGIESTILLIQNLLHKKNIELIKSYGILPQIECYPGQLNQVFMNVLTNAIDAIGENVPNKTGERKITIVTSKENDKIKISVRDTGKGMSDEVKQKIFDPFFTTKDVGKGTGLGLSISYGIIEKHNGTIEVKSEVGKGSEFVIWLPI